MKIDLTRNELKALEMFLSYLNDKKDSYQSELTGKMYKGQYYVSQEEWYRLQNIEKIVVETLTKGEP